MNGDIKSLKIGIKNFKTFKEEIEFEIDTDTDKDILAIIGPNACGKTTFFEALLDIKRMLKFNNQISIKECYKPYRFNNEKEEKNIVYSLSWKKNDKYYSYSIEFNSEEIIKETLKNGSISYFDRQRLDLKIEDNTKSLSISKAAKHLTAFFLLALSDSQIITNSNDSVADVYSTIRSIIDNLYVFTPRELPDLDKAIERGITDDKICELTSKADTTLLSVLSKEAFEKKQDDMRGIVKELSSKKLIDDKTFASHKKYVSYHMVDSEIYTLDYDYESDGTKKLFLLSPYVYKVLESGGYLFVDELDSQIHPSIIANILVPLFTDKKTNPSGAKLIFSMHNIGLVKYEKFLSSIVIFVLENLSNKKEFNSISVNDHLFLDKLIRGYYGGVPIVSEAL